MKKSLLTFILLFIKGALVGGCMIIPGMSAGTVIILVGLYGVLIGHLNGLFKSKKQFLDAVVFGVPLALGALMGIFALSRGLEFLIERFSLPVFALFAGLVLGSVPLVIAITYKRQDEAQESKSKFKWWHVVPAVLACAIVILFAVFQAPETGVRELNVVTGIMLVISGAVTLASMIIPGLSGAFMLVLMGYYETLLNAASNFNIPVLALFVLGAPIGLLVAAKGVGFFLRRFRIVSHMAIVGFLVGSVAAIFIYPGTYSSATGVWGIVAACVLFVVGFILVLFLSKLRKNKEEILKV
jgi:putative membrane protein